MYATYQLPSPNILYHLPDVKDFLMSLDLY